MTTKVIHEANLAEVNQLGDNSAEFVIRPLFYGYGNTLGNSIRRVLLSSIKGAAITAFSIEGTNHEYAPVAGIREDVVDIMLNLKNIRLKPGDVLEVRPKSQKSEYFKNLDNVVSGAATTPLSWLKSDPKKMKIEITGLPKREEAEAGINEQLIVEYYSR